MNSQNPKRDVQDRLETAREQLAPFANELFAMLRLISPTAKGVDGAGKRPAASDWPNIPGLSLDEALETIDNDGSNIGLRLTDDYLVVDVDPRNGGTDEALQRFAIKYGIDLGSRFIVRSGSGGRHFLLRKPANVKTRKSHADWPGFDFLSMGAQIVAPGSIHPTTGKPYLWQGKPPTGPDWDACPEAPPALLEDLAHISVTSQSNAAAELEPEFIAKILDLIPCENLSRDKWLAVSMAAIEAGGEEAREMVLDWWQTDPGRYKPHVDEPGVIDAALSSRELDGRSRAGIGTLWKHAFDFSPVEARRLRGERDACALAAMEIAGDFSDHAANDNLQSGDRKWLEWPDLTKQGAPRQTCRNVIMALRHLKIQCRFDEFAGRFGISLPDSTAQAAELSDAILLRIRHRITTRLGFEFNLPKVREAVETLADENRFDPVRDYLDRLKWDGKERLGNWLTAYLGAEDSAYTREVGSLMLRAAVRRTFKPGAKFDCCVVLEGEQGTGKSSALKILAREFFSDAPILAQSPQQQAEQLQGVLIYELSELTGLHKREAEDCKAFLSRNEDRVRHAYERYRMDVPRRSIFVGTTNDRNYLRDMTGNRRFLPIVTGCIDLGKLRHDRDQLFGEAVAVDRQSGGEQLQLAPELWADAAEIQSSRMEVDPWADTLGNVAGYLLQDEERVPSSELMSMLGLDVSKRTTFLAKRIAGLMQQLGWEGPVKMKWPNGSTSRGYKRPATSKAHTWRDKAEQLASDAEEVNKGEVPSSAEPGAGEST